MNYSLIIATYNWEKALDLVLKSVFEQSVLPNEIIIADDGSTPETSTLIEKYQVKNQCQITHIWQEDNGFRKSSILNKAIAKSKYEYIIQVDGDCILHPNFIEDHLKSAQKNTYLYGARVTICKEKLNDLFSKKQTQFSLFESGLKKRMRSLHLPFLRNMNKPESKVSSKFRGCNCSYFKSDALKINGYNEIFTGWGREDSDFAIRLSHAGVQGKRLKFNGIVFHIYHPEEDKSNIELNDALEQQTKATKSIRCDKGLNQYL